MRKLKLPGRSLDMPRLNENDIDLVQDIGVEGIKEQARQIVEAKLREQPENDGQQTPYAGNPVYKAMHACGAASRRDLARKHRIPAGKDLSDKQVNSVVNLIVRWIVREYNFYRQESQAEQSKLEEF
ncbi:MAG: DUF4186 family protein [Candidatus Nanohalobium sp.]